MFKQVVTIIVLFASFSVHAQKEWTLAECIDQALNNNISIKQSDLNSQLNRLTLQQNKAAILPSLNGSAYHGYSFGRSVDPFTNQFVQERFRSNSFSLSSSVQLFGGFQNINAIKQGKENVKAGEYDLQKMRNDISLAVATAYLQTIFSDELLEQAKRQAAITQQQVDRVTKMVDLGALPKGNLLDLNAQLAAEQLNVTNAENQLNLSYLNLAQLMEIDASQPFTVAKPAIGDVEGLLLSSTAEQVYQAAIASLPQVKSADTKVESSRIGVSIARGTRSPRLIMSGSYGTGYSQARKQFAEPGSLEFLPAGFTGAGDTVFLPSTVGGTLETTPFEQQFTDNINQTLGFNLTIPIFNGWQSKTAIGRADIAYKNAQYTAQQTKNTVLKDVQQAFADATGGLKRYNATKQTVEALQQSFEFANVRYEEGLLTTVDYNDAKNKLAKAESDLLQAKYDYVFKLKILEFYSGKGLSF